MCQPSLEPVKKSPPKFLSIKEKLLKAIEADPGVSLDRLAVRVGVRLNAPRRGLNKTLLAEMKALEKAGKIKRIKLPIYEYERCYPVDYEVSEVASPRPVRGLPSRECTVRYVDPRFLESSERIPTVPRLRRTETDEELEIMKQTEHIAAVTAALQKLISSGQAFTVGNVYKEAKVAASAMQSCPEIRKQVREASEASQEKAKQAKIANVMLALKIAISKPMEPFSKADICRQAGVDINFVDSLPEIGAQVKAAVAQRQAENAAAAARFEESVAPSKMPTIDDRYEQEKVRSADLAQKNAELSERNRQLRAQLAEVAAKKVMPTIIASPIDSMRAGLTQHQADLQELQSKRDRLAQHLELLNEQIRDSEAAISHYTALIEIEQKATAYTNGSSNKVEAAS